MKYKQIPLSFFLGCWITLAVSPVVAGGPRYVDISNVGRMPLRQSWNNDVAARSECLKTSCNRTQASRYGYDKPEAIRLSSCGESTRVPTAITGSVTEPRTVDQFVLHIDLTATTHELAGLSVPDSLHGRSLFSIVSGNSPDAWRTSLLYEAPVLQFGSRPLWAVRTARWESVEPNVTDHRAFAELYDLADDAIELNNLAWSLEHRSTAGRLARLLRDHRKSIEGSRSCQTLVAFPGIRGEFGYQSGSESRRKTLDTLPESPRTDIHISGVYPHLTTYGVYSQNGAHYKDGHNECGIGAVVAWAGRLCMVNYAPHMPRGSEHKLYSIDPDLRTLTIHPESVGGTPAGRMIHRESNQLLIAHYLINPNGEIRTIRPADMPIRVTAIARHLTDPANMVYYIDMEGSIWEGNVHTLDVKKLFEKPVPGWHGKGGYTGQGRLVVSNNGELAVGNYRDVLVGGPATNKDEAGVLAEWDGDQWRIIERRQFTDVTGPAGIHGGGDKDNPVWAIGWDRRSLRLKLLEAGKWYTYLLPKAALCNDARHGWYTEWPRIREITGGHWMMDMHGMFFDFPKTFSTKNSAGIAPIASHLRNIPDFCQFNGRLVLATDETSIQGNKLAGQPQSNLWFGTYEDLKAWGPPNGYGGPWIEDEVRANTPSDPFLVAGFDRRTLHLATGCKSPAQPETALRATDQQEITSMPNSLASLARVTVKRGDWHKPAPGYSFVVDQPVTVFLAVDQRGNPKLDEAWKRTDLTLAWGRGFQDSIYLRDFPAGTIEIPGNNTEHTKGAYGMPHAAFVFCKSEGLELNGLGAASVTIPVRGETVRENDVEPVVFTLQIDVKGDGEWVDYESVEVPGNGYVCHVLPDDFAATWLRLKTARDCIATAFLHQTTSRVTRSDPALFAGLAEADVELNKVHAARVYAAKRNRNLRVITGNHRYFDFTKAGFEFKRDELDKELAELLKVEPEFIVDEASVILRYRGRNLRLPKGNAAFDMPFASGWPRASREVESERHLANIHGTFYEVPLIRNGQPPAFDLMRPVASHAKQITDFCSWNGLLVLAGVRSDAEHDGHVFADAENDVGLWFGGVDDLWKLGKPVGHGGPWKKSPVKADEPSDPYLMTGYDKKTLTLFSDINTTIAIEIDFDHQSGWHHYKAVDLKAEEPFVYQFPAAFSAHWVRFIASEDCTATAQLIYE